jgi:carboxy-terminal domain RNA polymerase II polypeptide A small phosphatase
MDRIDPDGLSTARLYREHCSLIDGSHVKDLSKLGRRLENTIIVDNSPFSYRVDPNNAVPIRTWYDDMTDTELIKLIPFLQ